jgi:hypothetical protein
MPLFISFSSRSCAHSRPPVTAMQPARAIRRARLGVKFLSKRMLPHQVIVSPRDSSSSQSCRISAGDSASSVKWNPVCPVSRFSRSSVSATVFASGAS